MRFNMRRLFCAFIPLIIFSCDGVGGALGDKEDIATMDVAANSVTYTLPGYIRIVLINSPSFPDQSQFPTMSSGSSYAPVPGNFMIAECETTFQLYKAVFDWAQTSGLNYNLTNSGFKGAAQSFPATTTDMHPVTGIRWGDAVVWCNALTEYINSSNENDPDLDCVYYTDPDYTTPVRDPSFITPVTTDVGTIFRPYIRSSVRGNTDITRCTARGFRLPTSIEWEFAARYRGSDPVNAVLSDGVYYTNNDSPSGATASFGDEETASRYAVFRKSFTDPVSTQPVKSKTMNRMGLYDMSGNAAEWCFDEKLTDASVLAHVIRGGSWKSSAFYLQSGSYSIGTYDWGDSTCGFRLAKNTK